MSNLSLMSIMRDDPDFGKRLQKKVQEIKEDKQHLVDAAAEYSERYEEEIKEGTQLRAKLLTEGKSKGLSPDEAMAGYGRFVPTVYTPILNMLYFLLRESDGSQRSHYQRRDKINEYLIEAKKLDHDGSSDLTAEEIDAILDKSVKDFYSKTSSDPRRKELNSQFEGQKQFSPAEDAVSLKETPEMVEYLYGNITLDTFNKIKKLKALSKSPNDQEAFQAYKKALELCKQHNLDFDKIPCYVKGKDEK